MTTVLGDSADGNVAAVKGTHTGATGVGVEGEVMGPRGPNLSRPACVKDGHHGTAWHGMLDGLTDFASSTVGVPRWAARSGWVGTV